MPRVGTSATTGQLLYGWAHCVQSIKEILLTELNERVQRRGFGSKIFSLIDKPQNLEFVLDIYEATASALEPHVVEGRQYGEPGFVLLRTSLDAGTPGTVSLLLSGVFFEHGHLGDYSNPSEREVSFAITSNDNGFSLEAA